MEMPVYLFTGLLESGKTTLVQEVVNNEDFLDPGVTVLVQCEEGEHSYSQEFLKKNDIVLIEVEELSELNELFWRRIERDYEPMQIMVEYNGMWEMEAFFDSGMPEDWFVGGIYSTVNGETAEMYITNMRKIFMEPLRDSNLIIFNRCSEEIDRRKFRRTFKGMNPQVQVAFESPTGKIYDNEPDVMPYDYSGDVVVIEDMDYGLWYLDAQEHPERYVGKEIRFNARYCESSDPAMKHFVPGRHIMTCCEDDIEFLGFLCNYTQDISYEHGEWIRVAVKFDYGPCEMYGPGEEGPILELISSENGIKPEQELVTFT